MKRAQPRSGAPVSTDTLCVQEERVDQHGAIRRAWPCCGEQPSHFVKAKVRVHDYPDAELAIFHGPRCIGRPV
ncbi:hypothetical protein [Tateyamaria sp.]|uniref:hypothetical protein n=1 Tax=Tateyamaria sp. TaxID=1929288 RepID=UPI003B212362